MSETIRYWGKIIGHIKNEIDEIQNICREFQNAKLLLIDEKSIEFEVTNGWRDNGMSCEELIEESFGKLAIKKPHLKIQINCTYVEQAPVEIIKLENNNISSIVN